MLYITKEGDIEDLLGFNIDSLYSDTYHLSHLQLVNQILSDLVLSHPDVTPRNTPALTTNILGAFEVAENFDQQFHYHKVIGKLG